MQQNNSVKDKWQEATVKQKLTKLEKRLEENSDERSILKEKFDKNQSCYQIRSQYYDYLLYDQVLQRQISYYKNILLFGQPQSQTRSILELDFHPIMFSSNQKSIGDQNYQNIISILSLQSEFCIQEIRLFFYEILSNIRRHLKSYKNEVSTQTELIVTVQKNENSLNSKYLSKNPNKLEYFQQKSPYSSNNNIFLSYYFMGIKHIFSIKNLEMTVEDFMIEIFQQRAEHFEIVLLKNMNLEQIRIDLQDDVFLIELQQLQNTHNIYILPKSYQKPKISGNLQEIANKQDQSTQKNDFKSYIDQIHSNQQNKQKVSKQIDFSNFIDDSEEVKEQFLSKNSEQIEIISELSNKSEEQSTQSLKQPDQNQSLVEQNKPSVSSQIAQPNLQNEALLNEQVKSNSQQSALRNIFDNLLSNKQNVSDNNKSLDLNYSIFTPPKYLFSPHSSACSKEVQTFTKKEEVNTFQKAQDKKESDNQQNLINKPDTQNLISSPTQLQSDTQDQTFSNQESKNNVRDSEVQQSIYCENNQQILEVKKQQSITSFEVLQTEQKAQSKQDEQIISDLNEDKSQQTVQENQTSCITDFDNDSVQK